MNRVALLGVAAAAALLLAPAASAKHCVRITAQPEQPRVGTPVTLRLRTFEPVLGADGRVVAGRPIRIGQAMLYLVPPRAALDPIGLDLRRRRDDPSIWQATFVFRTPGLWRLRSIDETAIAPACRGRVSLRVRPRG